MENFYDVLNSMGDFEIRLDPNNNDAPLTRFKKIGQVKLSNISKSTQYENGHKVHLESLLQHFKVAMKWSPYHLSYFETSRSNITIIAFITFTNNDNHMDFIRTFDNMPFLNGRRLIAKPNGFTNLECNADIGYVRFSEQRYGVDQFNTVHYFLRGKSADTNRQGGVYNGGVQIEPGLRNRRLSTTSDLRHRIERDWDATPPETPAVTVTPSAPLDSHNYQKRVRESDSSESLLTANTYTDNKKYKVIDLTSVETPITSIVRQQPASTALGRFERYDSSSKSGELSDDDDDSWEEIKMR